MSLGPSLQECELKIEVTNSRMNSEQIRSLTGVQSLAAASLDRRHLGSPLDQRTLASPPRHQPVALPNDIGRRFGERLRQLRRTHHMTQLDLAVTLGIDRCYLSSVECGKKGVSLATLEVIALGFHLNLSELFLHL
jgi:DNA-binding XRE family transcriptional regulator